MTRNRHRLPYQLGGLFRTDSVAQREVYREPETGASRREGKLALAIFPSRYNANRTLISTVFKLKPLAEMLWISVFPANQRRQSPGSEPTTRAW